MILFLIFFVLGLFLIGLGIWIRQRPYGKHGVEVEAECIDVLHEDYRSGTTIENSTVYEDTKRPVYRYWYNGQYYTSSPILQSNRRGYRPQLGKCTIRINPDHPERVYSSERKAAATILIVIGVGYLILVLVMGILLRPLLNL